MSVSARLKQYGAFRAIGVSMGQLSKMIVAEAFTYTIIGGVVGTVLGLFCNKLLLTLEQIAAELPSEGCRGTPESMLYELEDALDTFFFRWSVCLSHNKDYFLAKKHNPKVNKLAENGLAYLNQILKGEIPL